MHTIRLRDPWQAEWASENSNSVMAQYARNFHRPSGLEASQSVELVITYKSSAAAANRISAYLNDQRLEYVDATTPFQTFSLSGKLLQFNRLVLLVVPSTLEATQPVPCPLSDHLDVELRISA